MDGMIAIIVAIVVLIVGLRIVIRKAGDDYSRPFFDFDEEQARRDVEESLARADSEIYTRKQLDKK